MAASSSPLDSVVVVVAGVVVVVVVEVPVAPRPSIPAETVSLPFSP